MDQKQILNYFMGIGVIISSDLFKKLPTDFDYISFFNTAEQKLNSKPFVINEDLVKKILGDNYFDKENESLNSPIQLVIERETQNEVETCSNVKIIKSYVAEENKRNVQTFVNHFKSRYESLRKILLFRQDLQESISIVRLGKKQSGERGSIIGLVLDKHETKNGNIKLTLEDSTGTIMVLVNKTKEDIFNIAKDLVNDEVIGISGVMGKNILFCNSLYLPDIPLNHELKKAPDEAYAVFISDIHFGIKNFISEDFLKFVAWLKGEFGNETHRQIARNVKYLFITGDVVEGVGIYPGQEEDLAIKDIYAQYEEATRYLKMVPQRIKIVACGGNHDAMRMSEPQPVFDRMISKGFYEMPNLTMVTNPSLVNIHASTGFPGFDVLMYHGSSFPYFGDNVPSIRDKGGIFRCDLIMKFLLQRRHLAPSHSSTLYVPDENSDPLVIEIVPAGLYRVMTKLKEE